MWRLNADQLHRQVKIFESIANLEILEENHHGSIAVYVDSFFTDAFTVANVNVSSGYILFLFSYAVVLLRRYANESVNVTNFLFDSCCKNSRGITDREPSFSVPIKFDSFSQTEKYIKEAYQGRI